MSTHPTNAYPGDTQEQPKHDLNVQNLEANSAANSLSRRSFLGRAGASSVAIAAAGVGLPTLMSERAQAEGEFGGTDARSDRSFQIRFNAAARERNVPIPPQINNGDEARYANFIGNYSQGLPHSPNGEVVPSAYQALLTAVASGRPGDFANIPLGGNTKLASATMLSSMATEFAGFGRIQPVLRSLPDCLKSLLILSLSMGYVDQLDTCPIS